MGKCACKFKRYLARETLGINAVTVAVFSGIFALLGLIFVIGGMDYGVYCDTEQPDFCPPFAIMVFFQIFSCAVLGACFGIIASVRSCRRGKVKLVALSLTVAVLFLCFAWISLVYTSRAFFIAFTVSVMIIAISIFAFRLYMKINSLTAWILFWHTVFRFYLACYSISLMILN
jgi:tryptophan-rich sensory protein